jgi:SAM-dependent methyltransferase
VLEIGVGSGVLVPTLTKHYAEYTGTDLTLAPGLEALVAPGCEAQFRRADLLADGDLPAGHYDAIVCFSVLEHISDAGGAARGLARALAPGGTLVTGYPMVSRFMTRAFALIGFDTIDDHHVSPPADIAAALGTVLTPVSRAAFPPGAPVRAALYQCSAWTTRVEPSAR